ncbi:MAG: class I SAM-dependent methyltransferase [Candidatus Peribacteraceae bacterium]|nr:class I SAM-dependent methyltransferase [Candidatus Peribacteraceae bacterium]
MRSIAQLIQYDELHKKGEGTREDEKLLIYSLIRQYRPKTVCEIGVSCGHLTTWIALAIAHNNYGGCISVDNWSKAHGGVANSPKQAIKRLVDSNLRKHIRFETSDSLEYLKTRPDNSIDFMWIDGNHDEENAYADIKEALRVAKCLIGVHDTAQQYTGPKEACKRIEVEYGKGFWVHGNRGMWFINKTDIGVI